MKEIHCGNHWVFSGRAPARVLVLSTLLLALPISASAGCNDSVTDVDNTACIAVDLMAADTQINQRYQELQRTLPYARFVRIRNEQRQWLKKRDRTCELHIHANTMDAWYRAVAADPLKAVCVTRLTQMRERMLASEVAPASTHRIVSPVAFFGQYDILSTDTHSHGKYYFEVDVNRLDLMPAGRGLLFVGLRNGNLNLGTMLRVMYLGKDKTMVAGIAADLDSGDSLRSREPGMAPWGTRKQRRYPRLARPGLPRRLPRLASAANPHDCRHGPAQ